MSGLSAFLKEKIVNGGLADPFGSGVFNYFTNGQLKSNGSSITEGIGQGRNCKKSNIIIDGIFSVSDQEALDLVFKMIQ